MLVTLSCRCKEFDAEMAKNAVQSTPDTPKRRRKHMMSDAEVITVLHLFPLRLQLLPQLQALLPGLCVRFSDGFGVRGYMW